jgi:hypothetical protein
MGSTPASPVFRHVAMSLDGFIAEPGDDMGRVRRGRAERDGGRARQDDGGDRHGAPHVRGRGARPAGIYGGASSGSLFVVTHDPPATVPEWMTGEFVTTGVADAVARARAAAGDGRSASSAPTSRGSASRRG